MDSKINYEQAIKTSVQVYKNHFLVKVVQNDQAPNCNIHFEYRVVIDIGNDLIIRDITGKLQGSKADLCAGVLKKFEQLKGHEVKPGIIKIARKVFAGTEGCYHLRNMLSAGLNAGYRWGCHLRHGREAFLEIVNNELPGTCYGWNPSLTPKVRCICDAKKQVKEIDESVQKTLSS